VHWLYVVAGQMTPTEMRQGWLVVCDEAGPETGSALSVATSESRSAAAAAAAAAGMTHMPIKHDK